ncbi:MAG: hypothetical protein H0V17_36610 [Deltaproteobacteria bacterium]|nr:hypothetical protein [Deltaproteobacteria bacterium]
MRRGVIALVIAIAGSAEATPYETFVDVSDQADLEDLFAAGDITQDTFEELLQLLNAGIDLNVADRALLYTLPNLTYDDVDAIIRFRDKERIRDPAQLVKAGALSEDKLFAIAAFIEIEAAGDRHNVKGFARLQTRFTPYDNVAPPWAFRARFTAFKHLQVGIAAAFTRLDVGAPQYDPNRDALIADPQGYRFALPKAFVKYETTEGTLIAGTFKAGFGQRLVFDTSSRYTPNGLYIDDDLFFSTDLVRSCRQSAGELAQSPCDSDINPDADLYVTPDWSWRDGLFGVGAGFKNANLGGAGWLQGYVWASASNRYVYQYELANRSQGKCIDPSDDTDPTCSAPTVFVRPDGNLLSPASRFSFVTLPEVFQERVAGVNVAYFADRRNSIGLTAYGATETNLVKGITLDTQEWSRIPTGGRFGAAGANMSFGRDFIDIFGEAAFSYRGDANLDPNEASSPLTGGGPAGIIRVTATRKKEELEAVFRYYSKDFINPFGRPIAQSDELDGQRARDEAGVRLRYYKASKLYSLRALLDVWENPSQREEDNLGRQQPKLDTYVRGDVRTTEEIKLGLWLRYQDKDLKVGGNGQCFEVSVEEDENGEPIPCGGRQLTTIGRIQYRPNRKFTYTAMLEHQLLDDPSIDENAFRQDVAGWLIVLWNPDNTVRVRARARYLDEAFRDDTKLETSLSTTIDAAVKVRKKDTVRVRADAKFFLDDRESTLAREPNPEISFWLSYEARL